MIGKEICEALGLDPKQVSNIVIECPAGIPAAKVTITMWRYKGVKLVETIKRYRLIDEPKDPKETIKLLTKTDPKST